jgi:hypothetical protein
MDGDDCLWMASEALLWAATAPSRVGRSRLGHSPNHNQSDLVPIQIHPAGKDVPLNIFLREWKHAQLLIGHGMPRNRFAEDALGLG